MITVNGELVEHEGSIADLLATRLADRAARGLAIAVNGEVVPRTRWDLVRPVAGDRVEIVTAVQGG